MTAINSVSFKGDQDQRSSGGGYLFPVVGGAAAGVVGGGFVRGFRKVNLEGVSADTFAKAMADAKDLTDEDKANIETIKKHLATNPSEESKTGDEAAKTGEDAAKTGEDAAKTGAKDAKEKAPKSLVGERSLDEVFGKGKDAKTEIVPDRYYEKYGAGATRETVDGIKSKLGKEILSTKGHIEHAKNQAKRVDAYVDKTNQMNAIKKQIAEVERARAQSIAKIAEETVKKTASAKNAGETAKIEQKALEEIVRVKKQTAATLTKLNSAKSDLQEVLTKLQNSINITDRNGHKIIGLEPTEDAIEKAIKAKGLEPGGAQTKKLIEETYDHLADERVRQLKEFKPTEAYDKAVEKAGLKRNVLVQKVVDEIVAEKIEAAKTKEIIKLKEAHLAKLKEVAQGRVTHFERRVARLKAQVGEINADINLVDTARKDKKKITRAQAEEVQGSTAEKIKSALQEAGEKAKGAAADAPKAAAEDGKKALPEAVEKALKDLKGKLPAEFKKINWSGLGWGAAIGLAAGVALKLIFGGGKSEE